ncbi:MAG TPA: hypothetical protein VG318_02060 [Actinomycetota bacterium]|nr:hypothetical protein [Actinomycetota bacterium]
MRKLIAGVLAPACLALGLVAAPATADSWKWRDRGGPEGFLSIESVGVGHRGNGPTATITFDRPLRPAQMGPKDFVILDVDSDGRGKSDEWIYLVSIRGRLRRFSYNPHSETVHAVAGYTFSRPTPRSVQLSLSSYVSEYSFAFAAGAYTETSPGCGGGCWDTVPNRGRLIHDWTPPQIKAVTEPHPWTLNTYVRFTWEALDYGLAGLKRSTLLMSEPGSGKWKVVQVRTEPGRYRLRIPVEQGANVMLRPTAIDGTMNKTLGPVRRTRVPYDQSNADGPGTFTGMWTEEEQPYAWGGTLHRSTAPMDTFAYSATANVYCFHGQWGPDAVRATFAVGGETMEFDTLGAGGYSDGYPKCITLDTVEERVATLTVQAGRMGVDWYWAGVGEGNGYDQPSREVAAHPVESPAAGAMAPLRTLRAARAVLSRS